MNIPFSTTTFVVLVCSMVASTRAAHAQLSKKPIDKPATLDAKAEAAQTDELDSQAEKEIAASLLTVGSVAPKLNIERWYPTTLSNSDPISKFEKGNVYVVEFWATWCGPCIAGIPHLKKVQETYEDQGVVVIGLTEDKEKTVEKFFERKVASKGEEDEETTYGELMRSYRVGSDLNGSVHLDYMTGAGQTGIPVAFIVGKTGLIEWIGHPSLMDGVLKLVVNDQWDKSKFDELLKKKWATKHERMAKQMVVKAEVEKLVAAHGEESLLKVTGGIEKLITDSNDATLKEMFREAKTTCILNMLEEDGYEAFYTDKDFERSRMIVSVLTAAATGDPRALSEIQSFQQSIEDVIFYSKFGNDLEGDKKSLRERVASFKGDARKTNELLWLLCEPANKNWGNEYDPAIIRLASELAKETLAGDAKNSDILYTLAHLHELQGDFKTAIEFQKQALPLAGHPISQKRHEKHIAKLKEKLNRN